MFENNLSAYIGAWIPKPVSNAFDSLLNTTTHWLNEQLAGPSTAITNKTFNELNYQDKDLWEGFFWADIEDIQENLSADTNPTDLKESLEDLWEIVGRSTLAPEIYEDGLKVLKKFIKNKQELKHFLPVLKQSKEAFREYLTRDQAFTSDCLLGDITQLLPRVINNTLSPKKFANVLRYYRALLTAEHYSSCMQSLFHAIKNTQAAFLAASAYQKALDFIQSEIHFAQHHPNAFAKTQAITLINIKDEVKENKQDKQNTLLSSNNSLLQACLDNIKTLGLFILEHPLEALTIGLALQIAAVAALKPAFKNLKADEEQINNGKDEKVKNSYPASHSLSERVVYTSNEFPLALNFTPTAIEPLLDGNLLAIGKVSIANPKTIKAQLLNPSAKPIGQEIHVFQDIKSNVTRISSYDYAKSAFVYNTNGFQNDYSLPTVIKLQDNNYVIVSTYFSIFYSNFTETSTSTTTSGIRDTNCTVLGTVLSPSLTINSNFQFNLCTASEPYGCDCSVTATPLSNGSSFVLAWRNDTYLRYSVRSSGHYYAQLFNPSGTALKQPFQVNPFAGVRQEFTSLDLGATTLENDNFLIAWTSSLNSTTTVYMQLYEATTIPVDNLQTYNFSPVLGLLLPPKLLTLANNKAMITLSGGKWHTREAIIVDPVAGKLINSFIMPYEILNPNNIRVYIYNYQFVFIRDDVFLIVGLADYYKGYDALSDGIVVQLASSNGLFGNTFLISSTSTHTAANSVNCLSDGSCLITWSDVSQFGRFIRPLLYVQNLRNSHNYLEGQILNLNNLRFAAPIYNDVSFDNYHLTMTLSNPSVGTLNSITPASLATADYNQTTGTWQAIGNSQGINDLLAGLQFIPTSYSSDNFTITYLAEDGIGPSYSGNITMIGIPASYSPQVLNAIPSQVINVGQEYTFALPPNTFFQPDGTVLVYDASGSNNAPLPSWLAFNNTNQVFFSTSRPNKNDVGLNKVFVTAFNNRGRNVTTTFDTIVVSSLTANNINNNFVYFENTRFIFPQSFEIQTAAPAVNVTLTLLDAKAGILAIISNNQTQINNTTAFFNSQQASWQAYGAADEVNTLVSNLEYVPSKGYVANFPIIVRIADGYNADLSGLISMRGTAAPNTEDNKTRNTIIGAVVGGVGFATLLAGAGVGFWRYRKAQQHAETRKKHPFANALRSELTLSGIDDFESGKGLDFVNAIEVLKGELANQGMNVTEMYANELKNFAPLVANAMRTVIGINSSFLHKTIIDTQAIQSHAGQIALVTKTAYDSRGFDLKKDNELMTLNSNSI